jgi:hypothetical protein
MATRWSRIALAAASIGWLGAGRAAAAVRVIFPFERQVLQTDEAFPVAVLRASPEPLAAGTLAVTLRGADGSEAGFAFAIPAVTHERGQAVRTEHLVINGRLLRPGAYTLRIAADGSATNASFEVCSHVRQTTFRLINWSFPKGDANQLAQGPEGFGYNLMYTRPVTGAGKKQQDATANYMRAGVDVGDVNVMGGGHQLDLRGECDWSDPYALRGGTRRAAASAMRARTRANLTVVNFYDEPGLTWVEDPETGERSPHCVPAQLRSFESAFGCPAPPYRTIDPRNAAAAARWRQWAAWKLSLMDAAWAEAGFAVNYANPRVLCNTQSQYGWMAFTDGYYFNVTRSLPVISGHGGYHDFWLGYFNPSFFLEMARARDWARPNWYLPTWYGSTTAFEARLENYLCFQTGIQGIMTAPEMDPSAGKSGAAPGIVSANIAMGRLGPIFCDGGMAVTRPPVALLYSLSQIVYDQLLDRKQNYTHQLRHGEQLAFAYLAGKLLQQPFLTVLDEDVVDGTLAAHHKAIVLPSVTHLDPAVVKGLEAFAAGGGLVLMTGDSTVAIRGAINLGVQGGLPQQNEITALQARIESEIGKPLAQVTQAIRPLQAAAAAAKAAVAQADAAVKKLKDEFSRFDEKAKRLEAGKNATAATKARTEADAKRKELDVAVAEATAKSNACVACEAPLKPLREKSKSLNERRQGLWSQIRMRATEGAYRQGAEPLAKAIKPHLDKAGIDPVFVCDNPGIVASRQAAGDLEYLFAVNADYDFDSGTSRAVRATAATIVLPADGRPVYDSLTGGEAREFTAQAGALTARLRLGPGQMRVFARAARPIAGVRVSTPVPGCDLTLDPAPRAVGFSAVLVDDRGGIVSGSAPLRIRVTDPLGCTRYDLYRATREGVLHLSLPLAANDPAGEWRIGVEDLLAGCKGETAFRLAPLARCAALAGAVPRAVMIEGEHENLLRFARLHQEVTIVAGESEFSGTAAERLSRILKPWNTQASIIGAAQADKPRSLSAEEARTWIGLDHTGRGQISPGDSNRASQVGFAVRGPVILLGNPQDNALIGTLADTRYLPFATAADEFPGRGRGWVAWQYGGIGVNQESVTLIAYDAAGMDEAVGSFYQAVAGQRPLTRWDLPTEATLKPAIQPAATPPAAQVVWSQRLPDWVCGFRLEGAAVAALTADQSLTTLTADGKCGAAKVLERDEFAKLRDGLALPAADGSASVPHAMALRRVKFVLPGAADTVAVIYWGGTVRIASADGSVVKTEQRLPQDVTAALWRGQELLTGLADGRVIALRAP